MDTEGYLVRDRPRQSHAVTVSFVPPIPLSAVVARGSARGRLSRLVQTPFRHSLLKHSSPLIEASASLLLSAQEVGNSTASQQHSSLRVGWRWLGLELLEQSLSLYCHRPDLAGPTLLVP